MPNIGIEFWLGNGYSITGNWMYSWWHSRSWDWWHRTYGGNIEIRKYFGEKATIKPLQGWHVGIYGQMLTYDFELGGRGYLGDRWTWGGGVSVGYSKPISRHLNLDFTLGLGYLGGKYKEYLPAYCDDVVCFDNNEKKLDEKNIIEVIAKKLKVDSKYILSYLYFLKYHLLKCHPYLLLQLYLYYYLNFLLFVSLFLIF